MAPNLLPLSEGFERLQAAGVNCTPSHWELWVKRRLISRAQRIPGSNENGLDSEQWRRLKLFASIHNQLEERASPEAIAYYVAYWGIEVNPELVADYIDKSIRSYFKVMRRRVV